MRISDWSSDVCSSDLRYRRALDTLLGPMLGAGNYTVEVHADVDMSESQATRESFPENDRALTSERITKSVSGTTPPAVGIPGALSNQPPPAKIGRAHV